MDNADWKPSGSTQGHAVDAPAPEPPSHHSDEPVDPYRVFRDYGRELGGLIMGEAQAKVSAGAEDIRGAMNARIRSNSVAFSEIDKSFFFKGRYDRSRARLPENIDTWRSRPDIANPGADLANWPNSAFTLPEGRVYIEFEPLSYSAGFRDGTPQTSQYSLNFLLRYGLTDNIELRLFGNGPTRTLGDTQSWGFSPLAFDTKVHLWSEQREIWLPALGVEAYIQTQWLGNSATNVGTQPSINFNFDQSLPWYIDFEYNLGAVRNREWVNGRNANVWEFSFQWSLQRDFLDRDLAFFIHGYLNAPSLPQTPNGKALNIAALSSVANYDQNVVGAGLIWTVNSRFAVWGQTSAGTNRASPSLLSNVGFAVAF